MDYGFRSRNGQNFFQIDSDNNVLNVAASGSYAIGKTPTSSTTITTAIITYPTPITTTEAPHVFLNPNNHGMYHTLMQMGGPGNWTGFYFKLHLMAPFNSTDCSGRWLGGPNPSIARLRAFERRIGANSRPKSHVGAQAGRRHGGRIACGHLRRLRLACRHHGRTVAADAVRVSDGANHGVVFHGPRVPEPP